MSPYSPSHYRVSRELSRLTSHLPSYTADSTSGRKYQLSAVRCFLRSGALPGLYNGLLISSHRATLPTLHTPAHNQLDNFLPLPGCCACTACAGAGSNNNGCKNRRRSGEAGLGWAGLGWAVWAGLAGLECKECGGNESYPGQRQGSHHQCGSPPSLLHTPGT